MSPTATPDVKTVLVVEDDPELRTVLRLTLERSDRRILTTGDGTRCLELARSVLPDLLILDWMIPGLSGMEVVEELRRHPETARLPVIMVTIRDDRHATLRASKAGVLAYFTKPFHPLELLEIAERALAPRRPGRPVLR